MKKVPVMVNNSFTLTERYVHTHSCWWGVKLLFREESSFSIVYSHFRHVLEFSDLFQVLTLPSQLNPIKICDLVTILGVYLNYEGQSDQLENQVLRN